MPFHPLLITGLALLLLAACDSRPDRADFFGPRDPGSQAATTPLPPPGAAGPQEPIPIPNDPNLPAPGARISGDTDWDACPQSFDFGTPTTANPEQDALIHGATGVIGHIIDGDTLDVIIDDRAYRIRLLGFDTPECEKASQDVRGAIRFRCIPHEDNDWWGYEAYCAAVDLAMGQRVTVTCDDAALGEPCTTDAFNRWLAYVRLPDGTDFGERMLREGAAWSFTRYESSKRARYCDAEDAAQEDGSGMWGIGYQEVMDRMSGSNVSWYRSRNAICAEARTKALGTTPCLSDEDCDADERCAFLDDLGSTCAPRWFTGCSSDDDCDAGSDLSCRMVPGLEATRCTPRWAGRFADGCFEQDELLCGAGSECVEPRRCTCPEESLGDNARLDDADIDVDSECLCSPPGLGICRFVAPACSTDEDCSAGWSCEATRDEEITGCLFNPEEWIGCPDELGGARCVPPGWETFLALREALAETQQDDPLPSDAEEPPIDLRPPTERIGCSAVPRPAGGVPALLALALLIALSRRNPTDRPRRNPTDRPRRNPTDRPRRNPTDRPRRRSLRAPHPFL